MKIAITTKAPRKPHFVLSEGCYIVIKPFKSKEILDGIKIVNRYPFKIYVKKVKG